MEFRVSPTRIVYDGTFREPSYASEFEMSHSELFEL